MKLTDDELSAEYKEGMQALTHFLEKREEWRSIIGSAPSRGVKVSPQDHADTLKQLAEFDRIVEGLETKLAKEYDRLLAEKEKEAEMKSLLEQMEEKSKRIYLIVKHTTPHLLESFHERVLAPLPDDEREEFLDACAILEATQLEAILNGTEARESQV